MVKATTLLGAAVACALIGGAPMAQAALVSPTPSPGKQQSSSQTTLVDPTQDFSMTAKPTVKATPYWGEPKAG
ncbi:hypothetical protein [Mycobacterium sp. M26]|uniref:hypothetical protein n=1 Tax=Mycobacterium sp. M26 TaxID=1762962 RepID=UPI00073E1CE4|nr:hypothetical protein [Mycobacterium sp. M26]